MKRFTVVISVLFLAVCGSMVSAQVPLPADISVKAPSPDLRKELAAFSGRWQGDWGALDSIFIVEEIGPEKARILDAWGDAPSWNITKGFRGYNAVVVQGKAELEFKSGPDTFWAEMNSDLSGIRMTRISPRGTNQASFRRLVQ
jgi:hypothetical protein